VRQVDVARGDERVDARPLRRLDRLAGAGHVLLVGARERRYRDPWDFLRKCTDAFEVTRRGDRKARLDDVDAESRKLVADLDLVVRAQVNARRLLAVTQRGVEDVNAVLWTTARLVGGHT
jgi:hypothetical protein